MAKPKAKKAAEASETDNAQGPITELPRELLTQIISYISGKASDRPEGENRDIENVRLVCRGFKDCAWQALGERLQLTNFDLRSIKSMSNLKAISKSAELAPFVASLQCCVGYVSNLYPGIQPNLDWDDEFAFNEEDEFRYPEEYLDDELFGRLCCYRHHTRVWFDDAWDWTPCTEHSTDSLQSYASDASKGSIIAILAQTLKKFENLRAVKYNAFQMPVSFRKLHNDIVDSMAAEDMDILEESYEDDAAGVDILGVDILLRGLAAGDVALKTLSIPVPAMFCQTVATYTDSSVLQKVLKSVEDFNPRSFCDRQFSHHLNKTKELVLSASEAPNLRNLEWEGWHASAKHWSIKDWMTIKTSKSAGPPLHSLHLYGGGGDVFDDNFFAFLSSVGTTLKLLKILMPFAMHWDELISFLATSEDVSLDKLVVTCKWPFNRPEHMPRTDFRVPPKHLVSQAAQEVVLEPDVFKNFMETKWAPKTPASRPKGKAKKVAKGRSK
ncbi:hypothetical protein BDV96DRAFT_561835 [Lophiotrema nucula]|uniref:F-box domain-containing protein n=1 Tax=Lophiotrema nucula TaxID=690887 RepID=A0A6A5ZU36_9PLEO|nr:hypothetical protein BDV96DRAFT_561835 [Lophiotrema nucula]